jgi:hypothetical protein
MSTDKNKDLASEELSQSPRALLVKRSYKRWGDLQRTARCGKSEKNIIVKIKQSMRFKPKLTSKRQTLNPKIIISSLWDRTPLQSFMIVIIKIIRQVKKRQSATQ